VRPYRARSSVLCGNSDDTDASDDLDVATSGTLDDVLRSGMRRSVGAGVTERRHEAGLQ
jgi:hypothetical protein